jgi:hypothetical protein
MSGYRVWRSVREPLYVVLTALVGWFTAKYTGILDEGTMALILAAVQVFTRRVWRDEFKPLSDNQAHLYADKLFQAGFTAPKIAKTK